MSSLLARLLQGTNPRVLGGARLRYADTSVGAKAGYVLAASTEDILGSKCSDYHVACVAKALLLLNEHEWDIAHDLVARADLNDADVFYVHALIHRAEGPHLGDPPANVQGYLNSNYWLLRTAHAVGGHAGIKIGTVIPSDLVPVPHPVWRRLALEPCFAELQQHMAYQRIFRYASENGGYRCGRFNAFLANRESSCWDFDPFAFTLCCEASFEDTTGDMDSLRLLCESLQMKETSFLIEHVLDRARDNQS